MSAAASPRPSWEPHGLALLAFLEGDAGAAVTVHGLHAEPEVVPAALFFRGADALEPWETAALGACRGRVLDLGAGAGAHALPLQSAGHPVVALDESPEAVEVLRRRGVADARRASLAEVDDGPYDTLLLLMHGVGLVGDVDGLAWMLADAHRLLGPGGRLVLDSSPPGSGEVLSAELWLEHAGVVGAPFRWLFLSAAALARQAERVGWTATVVHRDDDGRYVARLERSGS